METFMFITSLYADKWVSRADKGETIAQPSWIEIERAIRTLDGKEHTSVMIRKDEETYMSIGGGPNAYTLTALFENQRGPYYLLDQSRRNGDVLLVVGGQSIDVPAKMVVPLGMVLIVAKSFAERGELQEGMSWQEGV
jgi:hypothetical protein